MVKLIALIILTLVCGSGCVSGPPYLRNAADRAAYAGLTATTRESVSHGVLEKGMASQTVRLALGRPGTVRRSSRGVEWLYYGTQWVDAPVWYYMYSRYGSPALDFRTDRIAITYVRLIVTFEKDELVSWQEIPPGPPPYVLPSVPQLWNRW